jgi:hypothetical protein
MLLQRLQDLKLGCVFLPDSFRLVLVHTKVRRRGFSWWMVGWCARRVGAIYEKRSALVHSGKEEVTEDYLESLDGFIESMKYSVPLGW